MTSPIRTGTLAGGLAGAAFSPMLAARARIIGTEIDVEEKATIIPTIVRGGEEVRPPIIDNRIAADFITGLVPIARPEVPRVVSQSIPAATRVPRGTPVDLTFVRVNDISFGLFGPVHADLRARTVDTMLPILDDPDVAAILKKPRAQDLTDPEKATLQQKLGAAGITVNDADADRTTAKAWDTLQNARAFK